MIRNIVFDMGQVLLQFAPKQIIANAGIAGEDAELLQEELFRSVEWIAGDRGTMEDTEVAAAVCARLPERLHEAVRFCACEWWKTRRVPIGGMSELVQELKAAGYGLYVLSNANKHLHEYCVWLPGYECFDGIFVSADWKLLKPERAIYEKFLSLYELNAEDCVFVDENPLNVEAATLCGMGGIVFRGDADRLRRELRELGIGIGNE